MTVPLLDVRAAVVAALGDTWPVIGELPDACEPPALMFLWQPPMIRPLEGRVTMGGSTCQLESNFAVRCVAARLEPGPGVVMLETLLDYTLARMDEAAGTWLLQQAGEPQGRLIAGQPFLVADAVYRLPVTVNGG